MKKCKKCEEEKPTTEFYKDTTTADRLRPFCKPCWNRASSRTRYGLIEKCGHCGEAVRGHDKCKHCEILIHDKQYKLGVELSRTKRSEINGDYCVECMEMKIYPPTIKGSEEMFDELSLSKEDKEAQMMEELESNQQKHGERI